MLGPMGSSIMSILKVLTPAEIDRYTEDVLNGEEVVEKIAAGAEGQAGISYDQKSPRYKQKSQKENIDEEHKAKIIPINEEVAKQIEVEEETFVSKKDLEPENELNSIGIHSARRVEEERRRKQKLEDSKKESTSVFILNQREKLKKSQDKLSGQAAILLYRKSATQEVGMAKDSEDEEENKVSGSSGILINKKHY